MWAVWLRIPHQNAVKVPLTTRTARQGRCFGQRLFVGNYLGLTGVTTCDKIEALETVTTFGPKLAETSFAPFSLACRDQWSRQFWMLTCYYATGWCWHSPCRECVFQFTKSWFHVLQRSLMRAKHLANCAVFDNIRINIRIRYLLNYSLDLLLHDKIRQKNTQQKLSETL